MTLLLLAALQPLPAPPATTAAAPGFADVAATRGIAHDTAARAQFIDVNADGWLDVVIGGEPTRILLSTPSDDGGRRFVAATAETGLGDRAHSMLLWGDVNNDAHLDAISIVSQNQAQHAEDPQTYALYLGDGRGHFARQSACGLEQPRHSATVGAVLADLDLDGRLDAAFGNQYDGEGLAAQPMRVFRGDGAGHFEDVTAAWGFPADASAPPGAPNAPRPLYGLTASDLDRDGFPELLGAADGRQWNTLWRRSPEAAKYDDVAADAGVDADAIRHGRYSDAVKTAHRQRGIERDDEPPFRTGGNTFSLVPADFDNDGDFDLFSAEITHAWAGDSSDLSALLVSRVADGGGLAFDRQIEVLDDPDPETARHDRPARGLARDHAGQSPSNWNQGDLQAHWADLDNDGLLDLIVCESDYPQNRLRVFMQRADHTFAERSRELGLDWPNCPGVAIGDYDNDGDLDLLATGSTTRWPAARPTPALALFDNRLAPPANGWLQVQLVGNGTTGNASAIGARLELTTSDGRTQTREAQGPYGHWAAQSQPGLIHFGVGGAEPRRLTVIWPDVARTRTTIDAPAANQRLVVRQPG